MKCKNCGFEMENNSICPQCGTKHSTGEFPTWVVVILIIISLGLFMLATIGVVAAMTLPALISNTDSARNKTAYKKALLTLNQSLIIGEALNDKTYSKFNDVWNLSLKKQLVNLQDIPDGIILADGIQVKYKETGKPCRIQPAEATADSTCAILTIDTNGFEKGPNKRTEKISSGKYTRVNDQFRILLYSTSVAPEKGSAEDDIIHEYRK